MKAFWITCLPILLLLPLLLAGCGGKGREEPLPAGPWEPDSQRNPGFFPLDGPGMVFDWRADLLQPWKSEDGKYSLELTEGSLRLLEGETLLCEKAWYGESAGARVPADSFPEQLCPEDGESFGPFARFAYSGGGNPLLAMRPEEETGAVSFVRARPVGFGGMSLGLGK